MDKETKINGAWWSHAHDHTAHGETEVQRAGITYAESVSTWAELGHELGYAKCQACPLPFLLYSQVLAWPCALESAV